MTLKQRDMMEHNRSNLEIIGFLDAQRTEALESLARLSKERQVLSDRLERDERQAKILTDMSSLISKEKDALEGQSKAQRKVLVREIKTLRQQNVQLITQKQSYQNQLDELKATLSRMDYFFH